MSGFTLLGDGVGVQMREQRKIKRRSETLLRRERFFSKMSKSRELYRGIRDITPLSRELQSSIKKLCKKCVSFQSGEIA